MPELPAGTGARYRSVRAAMEVIDARKTKVQSWYLDITMLAKYWGEERVYHHTAPINMTYGLYEALRLVLEEGLESCFARHRCNHQALESRPGRDGHRVRGAAEGHQLPMLNAVQIPDGVDDAAVRTRLLERFGIEIGGGLGAFKGKVWRIGLMGYGSRRTTCCCCSPRSNNSWPSRNTASTMEPRSPPPRPATPKNEAPRCATGGAASRREPQVSAEHRSGVFRHPCHGNLMCNARLVPATLPSAAARPAPGPPPPASPCRRTADAAARRRRAVRSWQCAA